MIKVNARKIKWDKYVRKLCVKWTKVVNSVYFRLFWGKIKFTNIVFLDMWGQPLEWSAVARGRVIGHHAYGNWYGVYCGEDLYSWCYEGKWGYVDEH